MKLKNQLVMQKQKIKLQEIFKKFLEIIMVDNGIVLSVETFNHLFHMKLNISFTFILDLLELCFGKQDDWYF